MDRYLGNLYPDYEKFTRPVLVRQARDLLVCTFHGDLLRFEQDYLSPAADIISRIKNQNTCSCCSNEDYAKNINNHTINIETTVSKKKKNYTQTLQNIR